MSRWDNMKNILCTNVKVDGEVSDVMVFTVLTAEILDAAYKAVDAVNYDEIYEVPDKDVGYYDYEPCYMSEAEEARAVELATADLRDAVTSAVAGLVADDGNA